jgi:hypothetical protein
MRKSILDRSALSAGREKYPTLKWTRRSRPMALAAATQHKETQNGSETHRSTDHTTRQNYFSRGAYTWWDWLAPSSTSPANMNTNHTTRLRTRSNDGKRETLRKRSDHGCRRRGNLDAEEREAAAAAGATCEEEGQRPDQRTDYKWEW